MFNEQQNDDKVKFAHKEIINNAKSIGMQACIDSLGRSFVKKYKNTSVTAFGEEGNELFCFLGISTKPIEFSDSNPNVLTLSMNDWEYSSSCVVSLTDGTVSNLTISSNIRKGEKKM